MSMRKSATSKLNPLLAKIPAEHVTDAVNDYHLNDCVVAIEFLNTLLGSKFRTNALESVRLLTKLYRKGYSLEDAKAVIEFKVKEWRNVPEMKNYLRPRTLFDLANFNRYHSEVIRSKNPQP